MPKQFTPEWLTDVLREGGFLSDGKVISIISTFTKEMPMSVVSRLEVGYSADAVGSVPTKLFLKKPRNDRSLRVATEHIEKEVEFYRTIAYEMPDPPFIRCFAADCGSEGDDSFLLLEDLSQTHVQPEAPNPPSAMYSELAVECLARLHAYWWADPRLGKSVGKLFNENELATFLANVEKNVVDFVNFLGSSLPAKERNIYDRLLKSKHRIWGRLTDQAGLTVTHGDAHWWNFLYPRDRDTDRVRLFDWQLWHIDMGTRDLAFLVALGGFASKKIISDNTLVRRYYDTLVAEGVENYTWDDCWNEYRSAAIRNLNIPVIFWSQGKERLHWQENLDRALRSFGELGCSELLEP